MRSAGLPMRKGFKYFSTAGTTRSARWVKGVKLVSLLPSRAATCSGFLLLAAKKKYCVDRYADAAVGVMGRNALGKEFVSLVTLRPKVGFSASACQAWMSCTRFITGRTKSASSPILGTTEIRCEPVLTGP